MRPWLPLASLLLAAQLPAQYPIQVLAFGDSTTAARDGVEKVYAERLPGLLVLEDHGALSVIENAGVPGDTTERARGRLAGQLGRAPHIVVIQFGLNDSCVDVHKGAKEPRVARARYLENLRFFVRSCREARIGVVLMTPNPMTWRPHLLEKFGKPPYDPDDRLGFNLHNVEYAADVRRLAREEHTGLVDVYRAFLDYDAAEGQSLDDLLLDGMHPNDAGHGLIAELLTEQIVQVIRNGAAGIRGIHPPPPPRGYSIPLLDLAADGERQVVVDREAGQYLGHPTTVLLEDGRTMLCVYPKGHGRGAIVYKRSTDGGLTWSDRLPTPASWSTSKEVPTLFRVDGPEGDKRLLMFSGLHPIRMAKSDDDGSSWSELEPIGEFGGIVAMGALYVRANGEIAALFHDDGRFLERDGRRQDPIQFFVYQTVSADCGETWSRPEVVAHHRDAHLCEPGIVRSPDGALLAMLLRENSRYYNGFVCFSSDEGRTWSEPHQLPGALTGDRHTAKYAPDGRLFISFRDTTHESPTQGDWVGWVGTFNDIVERTEGQYRVRLMDNHHRWDCAYPGVEVLPDGTFVCTTYGHWEKGEEPYVVSVRFTLAELDALAHEQSGGK